MRVLLGGAACGSSTCLECSRDQSTVAVEIGSESATALSASAKGRGNALPRLAARRRIPRQAVALKKYRCGSSPVSKTSDNEHTTASLGYSKELSVKNSVGEPIPEFAQHPEEGSKILTLVARQDTGDVLPYQPLGAVLCSNGTKGKHEVATRVIQSLSKSCDAEGLAGGSSAKKVNCDIRPFLVFGHIAPVGRVGVVVGEDCAGEGFDFAEGDGLPSDRVPSHACRLDAAAHAEKFHLAPSCMGA